jgi:peroxiredoxin family protein
VRHGRQRHKRQRQDRESLHHRVQGFPGGHLSGPDHGHGARAEGIEANLFFTFFGLDAIHKARHEHIKLATVGNPGLHLATWAGGLPGVSSVMTHYMAHKMGELDIPPVPEFIEMIADTGAGLYGCKASVDLFGLTKDDFIDQVKDIITVGEFYDLAAGGQIIFT